VIGVWLYLLGQLIPHDQPAAVRPYNPAAVRTEIQRNLRSKP
jgi:hypothetical protein